MKETMKDICYSILYIVLFAVMASCSSTRKMTMENSGKQSVWNSGECVAARLNLKFADSSGKGTSIGGSLRMKRDDVVQLNATYILGIQVGTLEMTRDSIVIISRTTRQYAVFGYPELSAMLKRELTFDDMQSLFWGEAKDLKLNGMKWKYGSFVNMQDNRKLPGDIKLQFADGKSSVDISLELSNHQYNGDWNTRTKFNTSNYTGLSLEQAVKIVSLLIGG